MNEASVSESVTKRWNIVNDNSKVNYAAGNEINYNTEILKSSLCDYDAYITMITMLKRWYYYYRISRNIGGIQKLCTVY